MKTNRPDAVRSFLLSIFLASCDQGQGTNEAESVTTPPTDDNVTKALPVSAAPPMAVSVPDESLDVRWQPGMVVMLGQGWDSYSQNSNRSAVPCYISDPPVSHPIGNAGMDLYFQDSLIESSSSLTLSTDTSAKAEIPVLSIEMGVGASGGLEATSFTQNTRTHFVIHAWNTPIREMPVNIRLSDYGNSLADKGVSFFRQCGNKVVTSLTRRPEAKIVYTIETTTAEKMRELKAQLKAEFSITKLAKGKASLDIAGFVSDKDSTHTVKVQVIHSGRSNSAGLLMSTTNPKLWDNLLAELSNLVAKDGVTNLSETPLLDFVAEDPVSLFPSISTQGRDNYRLLVDRAQQWSWIRGQTEQSVKFMDDLIKYQKLDGLPVDLTGDAATLWETLRSTVVSVDTKGNYLKCQQAIQLCNLDTCNIGGCDDPRKSLIQDKAGREEGTGSFDVNLADYVQPVSGSVRWQARLGHSSWDQNAEQLLFSASVWPEIGFTPGVVSQITLIDDERTVAVDLSGKTPRTEQVDLPQKTLANEQVDSPEKAPKKGQINWYSLEDVLSYPVTHRHKDSPGGWYCWGGQIDECGARARDYRTQFNLAVSQRGLAGHEITIKYKSVGAKEETEVTSTLQAALVRGI